MSHIAEAQRGQGIGTGHTNWEWWSKIWPQATPRRVTSTPLLHSPSCSGVWETWSWNWIFWCFYYIITSVTWEITLSINRRPLEQSLTCRKACVNWRLLLFCNFGCLNGLSDRRSGRMRPVWNRARITSSCGIPRKQGRGWLCLRREANPLVLFLAKFPVGSDTVSHV